MRSTVDSELARQRPDHENAGGLHAARIAALGLRGIERIHQALGHRALAGCDTPSAIASTTAALASVLPCAEKFSPVTCPA